LAPPAPPPEPQLPQPAPITFPWPPPHLRAPNRRQRRLAECRIMAWAAAGRYNFDLAWLRRTHRLRRLAR
jgi:hypothetical protein